MTRKLYFMKNKIMNRKLKIFNVIIMLLICALAWPVYAAGRGKQAAPSGKALAHHGAELSVKEIDNLIKGIAGFEGRALKYDESEKSFVFGYAHFVNGNWKEAEHYLGLAEGKLPLIADHIFYFRGAVANRLGKYSDAHSLLTDFINKKYDSVWNAHVMIELGIANRGMGRYLDALRALNLAFARADDILQSRVQREIALTQMAIGDKARAVDYIQNMALRAAGERELAELDDLFDALKKRFGTDLRAWLNEPSQQLRLAQNFVAASQWADAAKLLEHFLKNKLDAYERARARWMLARCYRWTDQYDDAISIMEDLRKEGASIASDNEFLSMLATTYMKKSDYKKALAIREKMLANMPQGSHGAAQMAHKIAFLYMDQGKYADAIPLWERAASMRASGHETAIERWYIGWCNYKLGKYEDAVHAFDGLLKQGAKSAKIDDRVQYWKANALLNLKNISAANAIFLTIVGEHPLGYYAELSRRALANDRRDVKNFAVEKEHWRRESGLQVNDNASSSLHIQKAAYLDKLGLHEEAAREIRISQKKGEGNVDQIIAISLRNFAHDLGYSIASGRYKNMLNDQPGSSEFANLIWKAAYPRAYEPAIEKLTAQSGVDPMLVWAIMQNESAFKPAVISPAGAVGLMQLMPSTAGKVGKTNNNPSREELSRPAENIFYGTAYLVKLSNLFSGNIPAIIASYNAGEKAVERWLKNRPSLEIEEWIEEIPYSETNLYVKKVLTSYWKYQKLYKMTGDR